MRKAFVAATAMAAALMGVQPAAAQQYRTYHDAHVANQYQCQQSRTNRTAGGAVIGGILGAVLGHNAANSRSTRDEGRVLGAVVGAVAGGAIGRSTARCDSVPQGEYDPYYGQAYRDYRDDDRYYEDDLRGGPYEDEYYEDDYYGDDGY
ncbi:MAG TPA: YMGG-like glycine zipper-containing protein [Vitreimonas sp.]|nr:YMGG-like glycine zipper-containing protein [Vitreimonas sp.]